MSLKDELSQSRKLDPRLRVQILRLDDGTDPDQPLFSALLRLDTEQPLSVPGALVTTHGAGNIFTAHEISLNGLKNLVDSPRVSYVEGGRPLYPDQAQRPKGPRCF